MITISSTKWVSDLHYFYNLPTTQTNIFIPNLNKEKDIQTYLLGYLDAGAYIGYRPTSTNREIFSICITGHPTFCNWTKEYINKWFPANITSTPSIKSDKTATYFITGKRAFSLYYTLTHLPVNKYTRWLIDYSQLDEMVS